jgi:hypothetical protein
MPWFVWSIPLVLVVGGIASSLSGSQVLRRRMPPKGQGLAKASPIPRAEVAAGVLIVGGFLTAVLGCLLFAVLLLVWLV